MRTLGRLSFGTDSPGRYAASPGSGYEALKGFPRSLSIVVADDEPDTVTTLAVLLRDEGHEVRAFTEPAQVLAAVRTFQADVVILDIAMPKISGYELARKIREHFGAERPLLIAVSGVYRKEADKLLSRAAGFDHHLTKPCDPKDLIALLAPLAYPGG